MHRFNTEHGVWVYGSVFICKPKLLEHNSDLDKKESLQLTAQKRF